MRLAAKGVRTHSHYDGWPVSAMRIPFIRNEVTAKIAVEPLMVMALGLACWWISDGLNSPPGLASFLLWGGVTLPAVETIKQARWARCLRMLDDATDGARRDVAGVPQQVWGFLKGGVSCLVSGMKWARRSIRKWRKGRPNLGKPSTVKPTDMFPTAAAKLPLAVEGPATSYTDMLRRSISRVPEQSQEIER